MKSLMLGVVAVAAIVGVNSFVAYELGGHEQLWAHIGWSSFVVGMGAFARLID